MGLKNLGLVHSIILATYLIGIKYWPISDQRVLFILPRSLLIFCPFLIERTTPHAPTNVTVTSSETFAVTIEWMPGYSGCSSCDQNYKIRWRI